MTTTRTLLERLLREARRAHEDEDGSSMVFGAITLFTLALFTIMVWVIGMNSGERLQAQTAADSAAYSGALVEAEALESIAFLNDGMAYVYYTECRYAIDSIVYGTLQAFHEHDQWVYQFQPNRTQNTNGPSPGIPREWSVGGPKNNPGGRAGQSGNYAPGLEVAGYVPLGGHPATTINYDWVPMGQTSPNLFEQRFRYAMTRANVLMPRGKEWLRDIHFAERVILNATPRLVKKACIEVALANGAEWVSISKDLDEVFQINGTGGFTDGGTGAEVNGGMVDRYGGNAVAQKKNPIDGTERKLPGWFRGVAGRLNAGADYAQVRVCWNKRDWDHCEKQGFYPDHPQPPFTAFTYGAPAGHWHIAHVHGIDRSLQGQYYSTDYVYGAPFGNGGPYTHNYGHGVQSGQDAGNHSAPDTIHLSEGYKTGFENGWARFSEVELNDPNGQHHMAQTCPTCAGGTSGGPWAEVRHGFTNDGSWAINRALPGKVQQATTVQFANTNNEPVPRPLLLKGKALRHGVTVLTWRKSRGLTPQHFPANDFGIFALATGQVGIRNPMSNVVAVPQEVTDQKAVYTYTNGGPREVMLNPGAADQGVDNFYLGSGQQGDPGLRFGARLVPVKRDLSWVDGARSGLEALFTNGRWYDRLPGSNGAVGAGSGASGELAAALQKLGTFVDPRGKDAFAQ